MSATFGSFALIPNEEGRVLLVLRNDLHVWNLPGGGVEEQDRQSGRKYDLACLKREVLEETGLIVTALSRVGIYLTETIWDGTQTVSTSFLCSIDAGQLTLNPEAEQFGWFLPGDLPERMFEPHRQMILDLALWREKIETSGLFVSRDLR